MVGEEHMLLNFPIFNFNLKRADADNVCNADADSDRDDYGDE